ncbi:MAG: hypothetical protein JO197_21375 [Acidobacteria bacterium]|nr:hypothetical protein [Acidobacteriota bacterium]MBV9475440.1 hypothetical protein [Acidobacteriota bacterium]
MKSKNIRLAVAVAVAALVAVPMFAARGSANFTRFVVIGDSYGAGFQSGSLNINHQVYSWPAIIAQQAGLKLCGPTATATDNCFAQPLVSYPGIGPELVLQNLTVGPVSQSGQGTPLMTTFGRPYNNLSVPGATVGAALAITGAEAPSAGEPTAVTFGRFILRGLGTEVQQAVAQHPTFIAMWLGGNDYLGSALAGTDKALTPTDVFAQRYNAILDQLVAGAPDAGMVVGNLPAVIPPIFTLVPPFVINPATSQPVLGPDGKPIYYIAELGDGTVGQLPPGSLVLLDARAQIASGFGLPPVPPFNALPNAGKPLPDRLVLTPTEIGNIVTRVGEYNNVINQAATARNIPVADIAGLFNSVTVNPATGAGGLQVGPVKITNAFVTGGFFSLDGFHLTDFGYLLFADQYIRAINAGYGTEIPLAGVTPYMQQWPLPAQAGIPPGNASAGSIVVPDSVSIDLRTMFGAVPPARHFRAVHH